MNGVRVYMRAGWSEDRGSGRGVETRDVTVLEYKDAHYVQLGNGWLGIERNDEGIALFPHGEWVGVERF